MEKGTIAYSSGTWTIDPAAYLAYEGTSAFAGPWTVYFAGGTADGQGKANTNLANVTSSGKDAIVDIAFELDWANASNVAALSTVYTASRAGIIAIGANLQSPAGFVEAYVYPPTGDTPSFASINNLTLTQDRDNYVWVFVPKGCRYQVGCSSGATLSYARFIPFKNSIANS